MISTVLIETAGISIVLFTFRDVFHDIFHPTRSGSLSDFIGRGVSWTLRHTRFRPAIGPLALVAVIFCWVIFIASGFAIIYFPLLTPPLRTIHDASSVSSRILQSLYLSIGSLDTFQTFDVQLQPGWLKLIVALQGLVGISMITASVSWLVLLYPALERIRFLAKRTFILIRAKEAGQFSHMNSEQVITDMTDRVVQARIDLILFPILLNFYPSDPSQALAAALPYLQNLAIEGSDISCSPHVRLAAYQLHEALTDFSDMLAERVLSIPPDKVELIFRKFAAREN